MFRLWQIYLDNVNPLLKVTHIPTLQGRFIEAAANVKNIPPNLEVLMFSIYCMAVHSLDAIDCQTTFGIPKDDLLTRYQSSCQQALFNAGFLRSNDRDCLTAFYLYLVSPSNIYLYHCLTESRSRPSPGHILGPSRPFSASRCALRTTWEFIMRRALPHAPY